MNNAELIQRSLPPEAYDTTEPMISAEITADGNALDAAMLSAEGLLQEFDPATIYSLLPDYERVYKLSSSGLSLEQRRAQLEAKMVERGGQSRGYFLDIATRYGFPNATIEEFLRVATCNDNCNAALNGQGDLFFWKVLLPATGGTLVANCNSACDTALQSWGHSMVEAAIAEDKPAHTTVLFAYV